MVKKHLSVKKGLMKVSNKSYSSKRLLSKSRNAVSVSSPSQNENKRHEYCVGCKCKVNIINIKKNNIKGKGGILRPCITGECVKGHKWVRFVKNNNNTLSKSMKGGAHAYFSGKTIEFFKGIHYATIEDFINAQNNGISPINVIPGTTTNFDNGDGSTFKTALDGVNKTRKKQGHWIWYIIPSNLPARSKIAEFYRIDDSTSLLRKNTISPEDYIRDTTLFKNYVTIINAIHDALNEKNRESLKSVIGDDYDKLCNSLGMFRDIVVLKLEQDKPLDYFKSIEKINTLSAICGVVSKKQLQPPPPQQQLLQQQLQQPQQQLQQQQQPPPQRQKQCR